MTTHFTHQGLITGSFKYKLTEGNWPRPVPRVKLTNVHCKMHPHQSYDAGRYPYSFEVKLDFKIFIEKGRFWLFERHNKTICNFQLSWETAIGRLLNSLSESEIDEYQAIGGSLLDSSSEPKIDEYQGALQGRTINEDYIAFEAGYTVNCTQKITGGLRSLNGTLNGTLNIKGTFNPNKIAPPIGGIKYSSQTNSAGKVEKLHIGHDEVEFLVNCNTFTWGFPREGTLQENSTPIELELTTPESLFAFHELSNTYAG